MIYDYLIVGAGSAGCVLAARLSEQEGAQVGLLEAGASDSAVEIRVPAAFPRLMKTAWDWDLSSEPEPALDGRRVYLPQGRMVGGSSAMNAMVYIRGHRADYDRWVTQGATGWGYDDLLPYFKRSEDNERGADDYHGAGGPLTVSDSRSLHPLGEVFVEAAEQAGHERNDDFNGPRQDGVGRYQVNQREGLRCSSADAFLRPALERPNLTLFSEARATRVLFQGDRATGVEVHRDGRLERLKAREVILSAGAYHSPQILMLSGLGPAEELGRVAIRPRHDLPIGDGLQDHLTVVMNWFTDEETLLSARTFENMKLLRREGRGPLSSNITETGGFARTSSSLPQPDVQFHHVSAMYHEDGLGAPWAHAHGIAVGVVRPTSRGRLTLRSGLAHAKPRVFNSFLSTEEDRSSMLSGMRMGLEIARQEAFRQATSAPYLVPSSDSDEDVLAFVRQHAHSHWHPTGTCAIGKVVDSELGVLGVECLRVVDASVMPSVPGGNTNAPTIAVAERAAELILGPM